MKKVNIFIDGSWLFKACRPEGVLARKTEKDTKGFSINFNKLNNVILGYIKKHDPDCTELGERYLATSIFDLPEDFEEWPNYYDNITVEDIKKVRQNVYMRRMIADNAIRDGGYLSDVIYSPRIKGYIVEQLKNNTYQEKQVDASVVALLVRSAITKSNDYHVVITGDSDIIPAIKVAYPEYSKNVVISTTHPDELLAENRMTSYSFGDFSFDIEPLYLQDYVKDIIHGEHVYNCSNCNKVMTRTSPIPRSKRPYCNYCLSTKE